MAETKKVPNLKQKEIDAPEDLEQQAPEVQDLTVNVQEAPDTKQEIPELPEIGIPENTIVIGGKLIEIKPTKLKYQRNRTAVFYHALELYPLPDILAMNSRALGDNRDGDKALCDWLVAVTDDEDLVREHINEFDTDTVYRLLAIFRRVNKIDEREEKLKNVATPGTKAV